jgi:hypothetical protein
MQETIPPIESRLDWATLIANGTMTGVATYVGAKLAQGTSGPKGGPDTSQVVILPPGVDRK